MRTCKVPLALETSAHNSADKNMAPTIIGNK